MKSLSIPSDVERESRAKEVLRVWALPGRQIYALDVTAWDDPAAWGLLLTDLARHVARAYEQTGERTYEDAMARVLNGFDVERENPTDSV